MLSLSCSCGTTWGHWSKWWQNIHFCVNNGWENFNVKTLKLPKLKFHTIPQEGFIWLETMGQIDYSFYHFFFFFFWNFPASFLINFHSMELSSMNTLPKLSFVFYWFYWSIVLLKLKSYRSEKTWAWICNNRKLHNAGKTSVNWLQAEAFVLGPWPCVNSTKQKKPFWPTLYLQDKALAPWEFIFRITFGLQPSSGSAEASETAGQFLDSMLLVIWLWKANIQPNSAAMQ